MSYTHKPTITQRALAYKYWLWVGVEAALQLVIDGIARLKEQANDNTTEVYDDLRADIREQYREKAARALADRVAAQAKLRAAQERFNEARDAEWDAEADAHHAGRGGAYSEVQEVLYRGKQ